MHNENVVYLKSNHLQDQRPFNSVRSRVLFKEGGGTNIEIIDATHCLHHIFEMLFEQNISVPFHKSLYECFSLPVLKIVVPILNYSCNEFVVLKSLCEMGPRFIPKIGSIPVNALCPPYLK